MYSGRAWVDEYCASCTRTVNRPASFNSCKDFPQLSFGLRGLLPLMALASFTPRLQRRTALYPRSPTPAIPLRAPTARDTACRSARCQADETRHRRYPDRHDGPHTDRRINLPWRNHCASPFLPRCGGSRAARIRVRAAGTPRNQPDARDPCGARPASFGESHQFGDHPLQIRTLVIVQHPLQQDVGHRVVDFLEVLLLHVGEGNAVGFVFHSASLRCDDVIETCRDRHILAESLVVLLHRMSLPGFASGLPRIEPDLHHDEELLEEFVIARAGPRKLRELAGFERFEPRLELLPVAFVILTPAANALLRFDEGDVRHNRRSHRILSPIRSRSARGH